MQSFAQLSCLKVWRVAELLQPIQRWKDRDASVLGLSTFHMLNSGTFIPHVELGHANPHCVAGAYGLLQQLVPRPCSLGTSCRVGKVTSKCWKLFMKTELQSGISVMA